MGIGMMRGAAAAGTVAVAAAVNVATGMLTQHWAVAWWLTTGVLVLAGGGLQAWLTVRERPAGRVVASGDGSVAAGDSVKGVSTTVTRPGPGGGRRVDPGDGVSASGLGAVAAGGQIEDVHTRVTGQDPTS
ncbi:hypothetical protein [Actinoallomurus rhizosphaericola]|uniref:hypothetical protein n=1 Tax=Actinoallomurus rhizosphaericola TaxID=2952536 RepID=UPI002091F72A|nr:hypothetical protein [Actinoallomurus rhizosphaericola]MCO5999689.1 hypothetical protein [Actinoallomurus rhizosphaericola]